MKELKTKEYKRFEDIKYIRNDGSEFWQARELAEVLDYTEWRNFIKVIDKAMIACNNSGRDVIYDFAEVSKIVKTGATSRPVKDYELSRYACYLIVQSGNPRKKVIALGQTSPVMKKATMHLMELSTDEKTRLLYEARLKEHRDNYAREQGAVKNREIEIAKNLLADSMSYEKIVSYTGLTPAEIESLRNTN